MLYISNLFPDAPIYGIGFSLGAGMMTKYIGTEGKTSPIKAGVVLGNPWDLMQCVYLHEALRQADPRLSEATSIYNVLYVAVSANAFLARSLF